MVSYDPKAKFAWSALTNRKEGYVFYTLKSPETLASTVFWLSHFGRSEEPWAKNGKPRHGFVMGIEDVSAYFCLGIAQSTGLEGLTQEQRTELEAMHKLGIKTFLELGNQETPDINYIMGVARVPEGFQGVASIKQEKDDLVAIVDKGGEHTVKENVDLSWLQHGDEEALLKVEQSNYFDELADEQQGPDEEDELRRQVR